jgi:hypothetical protein
MKRPEKVIERLNEYVEAADEVHQEVEQHQSDTVRRRANAGIFGSAPDDEASFQALSNAARSRVLELEPSVVHILTAVDEDLAARFYATKNFRRRSDLVRQAIAAVRTLGEVDEWLGPAAPTRDPRGLHRIGAGSATGGGEDGG